METKWLKNEEKMAIKRPKNGDNKAIKMAIKW